MTRARDVSNIDGLLTAKGDIYAATAAGTPARLGVGTNGQALLANSGTATGLEWASPAAGANWSLLNAGGTALTGADEITISGISGKDKIMIVIRAASSQSTASFISVRLNGTIADYWGVGWRYANPTTYSDNISVAYNVDDYGIYVGKMANSAGSLVSGYVLLTGCNSSGVKVWESTGGPDDTGDNGHFYNIGGTWSNSATISSVSVKSSSNVFDNGTVFVYGSA
jgi:hypothetical protein